MFGSKCQTPLAHYSLKSPACLWSPENYENHTHKPIANAHRDDRKRFVVRAEENLPVFAEIESATSTPDPHEFHPISGSGINLQNISNARGVELVFEEVGFQGRGLLRF